MALDKYSLYIINLYLYGIKYSYWIRIIFKQINLPHRILKGNTASGPSEPGSYGDEDIPHYSYSSRTGASPPGAV